MLLLVFKQAGNYTLDLRCVRAGEILDADNPLVAILNFAQNFFGDNIAECQCYVVEDSTTTTLMHNVTCGIQVTRCSSSQSLSTQLELVNSSP